MQIFLPDNHPTFVNSCEVNELLYSWFPNSPLTFFQFGKIHQDGSGSIITNKADLVKTFLEANIRKAYSCAKPEFIDKHSYWFLWEQHLQDFPFYLTREFNVSNGLCFLERHFDCYYMFSFGTRNNFDGAINYYLSNFEILRSFIRFFREMKTELITTIERHKISFPSEAQDPNKNILLLDKSRKIKFPVYYKNRKTYITLQEFECIKRLPLGKTAKDIAYDLNISPRTVESYFFRVMARVGCTNKRELILLLNQIAFKENVN